MIQATGLNVDLGEFRLNDVELKVAEGDFFVIMGPTGAGKTVLLEAIAGLVAVQAGRIRVAGRDVTRLPPERRGVGIVYQDYALFPHLTVRDNMRYGLRYHKHRHLDADAEMARLTKQLSLGHLLHRHPTTLSGGEQQRVALARALMVQPRVLLLDEPLSALDPRFRQEMRRELKRLHAESGVTFLMVTHNLGEAASLGNRGAILNHGAIEQSGDMRAILRRPASAFVAEFVGMKNIFPARFEGGRAQVLDVSLTLPQPAPSMARHVAIRPEEVLLSRVQPATAGPNIFQGTVKGIADEGFYCEVAIQVGAARFISVLSQKALREVDVREEMTLFVAFDPAAIHVF